MTASADSPCRVHGIRRCTICLLAGADDKHGEHENRSQGWDRCGRVHAARHGRLDPGADTYGRHAAVPQLEVRP